MRLASKKPSAAGAYNHDSPRSNRFSIYPVMVHNIRLTLAHTGTTAFESTKITTHKDDVRTCCTSLPQSILNLTNGAMLLRDPNGTNFSQFLALKFDGTNPVVNPVVILPTGCPVSLTINVAAWAPSTSSETHKPSKLQGHSSWWVGWLMLMLILFLIC